jgi:hypothetical protein
MLIKKKDNDKMTKLDRLAEIINLYDAEGYDDKKYPEFSSLWEKIAYASMLIAYSSNKKYPNVNEENLNEVLKFEKDLALEYAKDYLQDIAV